jgi:hypothetical protein
MFFASTECCGMHMAADAVAQDDLSKASVENRMVLNDYNGGLVLATTISSEGPLIRKLKASGWKPLESFYNPNSGNIVTVWGLRTHQKGHRIPSPTRVVTPRKRSPK